MSAVSNFYFFAGEEIGHIFVYRTINGEPNEIKVFWFIQKAVLLYFQRTGKSFQYLCSLYTVAVMSQRMQRPQTWRKHL